MNWYEWLCISMSLLNLGAWYMARRQRRKAAAAVVYELRPVTVQRMKEWVASGGSINLQPPYDWMKSEVRTVDCDLSTKDAAGNYVLANRNPGATVEDAFEKAVLKIEETIGSQWRMLPKEGKPNV